MPVFERNPGPPFHATDSGVRVALRVQPRARCAGIDGLAARADGAGVLKLRVTSPPEDGKANAAAIKLLAKAWGIPKSDFEIAAGAADRNKVLLVSGDPAALMPRLRAWLAGIERV